MTKIVRHDDNDIGAGVIASRTIASSLPDEAFA
ncbi:hypothetical protein Pla52o_00510 [Novipirellula galeiformis]|uniref:Uncharacterized protein n=1 Tax=Novipirellula galeiformis TaxID=2528004 RepID=A0A5C6CP77_9BACT|nr:hypothetical protein Pla52o_00510 [Novipirellula galeiformis]